MILVLYSESRKLLVPMLNGKLNDICFKSAATKDWNILPNHVISCINFTSFYCRVRDFINSLITKEISK